MAAPDPCQATLAHLDALADSLVALRCQRARIQRWGTIMAARLKAGARLFAAGDGASAAHAQQLTAEPLGAFGGQHHRFPVLSPPADTAVFIHAGGHHAGRRAYASPADIVVLLSATGGSTSLVTTARAAGKAGATVWTMTGACPNPLANLADDAICVPGPSVQVQEAHLVAVHLICAAFDSARLEKG